MKIVAVFKVNGLRSGKMGLKAIHKAVNIQYFLLHLQSKSKKSWEEEINAPKKEKLLSAASASHGLHASLKKRR